MRRQNHRSIFSTLVLISLLFFQTSKSQELKYALVDSIKSKMINFIDNDTTKKGLLFGLLNEQTNAIHIFTEGAIDSKNDLRVACPITKPCLSYLILKEDIDLDATIDKWFPTESGYQKSDSITIKMLLLNMSGIKDFARLIPIHPDSSVTPIEAINAAYKNKDLNFTPGEKFEYSNTNFNILGIILEKVTGKSFDQLIKIYFSDIAPSLRMDDGKGNYPKGYMKPWPFHWGATGYSGGLISTAEDAMKVFSYITKQPEFKLMSNWRRQSHNENMLYGFGIFGYEDYHGLGRAIYYDGNMIACQMFILKIDQMVYYFHTAHMENTERLYILVRDVVSIVHKS